MRKIQLQNGSLRNFVSCGKIPHSDSIIRKNNAAIKHLKNPKTRLFCISKPFTTDTIFQCRFALLLQPSKLTSENLKGSHCRFTVLVGLAEGAVEFFSAS